MSTAPFRNSRFAVTLMNSAAILILLVFLLARLAEAGHAVACQADLPVRPGETMTWRTRVTGGSGTYMYSWSGSEGLSGTTAVVAWVYSAVGYKVAQVTATDVAFGDQASGDCAMHVIPSSFVEPPNVNPVLWVPKGVDPAPMVSQLERVWRSIHAGFFHLYGKTFKMNPLRVVVSTKTEEEICGGDCTDLKKAGQLMNQAFSEADAAVGGRIPYTRAIHVMAWGGGAWAGSWGWDIALGGVGDVSTAAAAGVKTPAIEPDLVDWVARDLGNYKGQVNCAIAHELNHGIGWDGVGWDSPHDFCLDVPPTDYEKQVVLAGPFLTETPADITKPTVNFSSPADGATLSGTVTVSVDASDDVAMDAVVLLVDGRFWAGEGTAPFSFAFDTTLVGHGRHTLTAIAYDAAGNTAEVSRDIFVKNQVAGASCGGEFPLDTFHVCYYDGIGFGGTYLGTLIDHPFPVAAPNSGWGVRHDWQADEIAFGQHETVSGVWRGTLNFPPGAYIFRFFTDDGLRVYANGNLIIDEWRDQVAEYSTVVALNGLTTIQIEWYENGGGQALTFWWQPTATAPSLAPDLVETAVSNPPATALIGDSFPVTDTARNQGTGAAGASTTRYYLSLNQTKGSGDKLLTGTRAVPGLGPGAESGGTVTVKVPGTTKLGSYYLLACADDKKVVAEGNEKNNCVASTGTVEVKAPDLTETALSNPPASVGLGGSFPVTDTVLNQGNAAAGASTTRYYLSLNQTKGSGDKLLTGSRAVPGLGVGAQSTGVATVSVPSTTVPGTYYLLACADDKKKVFESNEKNNCRASATQVTVTP